MYTWIQNSYGKTHLSVGTISSFEGSMVNISQIITAILFKYIELQWVHDFQIIHIYPLFSLRNYCGNNTMAFNISEYKITSSQQTNRLCVLSSWHLIFKRIGMHKKKTNYVIPYGCPTIIYAGSFKIVKRQKKIIFIIFNFFVNIESFFYMKSGRVRTFQNRLLLMISILMKN